MSARSLIRLILISFGIALLLAGLFFNTGAVASSTTKIDASPTVDRLAEPTLPASPSQADVGAQVYWLSCLPCHGDKGQGLTDEFRATYPTEEQYCWESGCHGKRPYEEGFTIPEFIPSLIGSGALYKFTDAAQLNSYIRSAMPFWDPGSLTAEQAWQVTAFLLRENGIWDDRTELNETNAGNVTFTRQPLTPLPTPPQLPVEKRSGENFWALFLGAVVLFGVLFFILRRSRSAA
ncbi:MAG: hypothetical protein DCC56_05540 [Anaerolineae bacterium]|nr:MAG: hypothetical protein DCC56_05540 [Anaerolineae bacterium]WKZ43682.1 MAG: c-type cytochrome [Anaerolineales bacterium]